MKLLRSEFLEPRTDDLAKIKAELKLGENVIVDTTRMNAKDIAALRTAVSTHGWNARVKWYP